MRKKRTFEQNVKRRSGREKGCSKCGNVFLSKARYEVLCPSCLNLQEGGGRGRAPGSPLAPSGAQKGQGELWAGLRREGSAVHGEDQG